MLNNVFNYLMKNQKDICVHFFNLESIKTKVIISFVLFHQNQLRLQQNELPLTVDKYFELLLIILKSCIIAQGEESQAYVS